MANTRYIRWSNCCGGVQTVPARPQNWATEWRGMPLCTPPIPSQSLYNLDHPDLEMLWLEIAIGKQKVTAGCVYRPPSTPTEFWSALENVTEEIQGRSIDLLGDLNVNSIDRSDSQYKHFSSLCLSLQLQEIVQRPTRVSEKSAKCMISYSQTLPI